MANITNQQLYDLIKDMQQDVQTIDGRLSNVEVDLKSMGLRLTNVEALVVGLRGDMNALKSNMQAMKKDTDLIPIIGAAFKNYSEDVEDHGRRLNQLEISTA